MALVPVALVAAEALVAPTARGPRSKAKVLWIAAAVVAVLCLIAGTLVVVGWPGGKEEGGEDEIPYADDDTPGVIDAALTVAECAEEGTGFQVGGLLPLSGVLSTAGPAALSGLGLAISDINDAGGVLGEDACYLATDSQDTGAIDDLTSAEVNAVVGPLENQAAIDSSAAFADANIPHLVLGGWLVEDLAPSYRLIGDVVAMGDAVAEVYAGLPTSSVDAAFVSESSGFAVPDRDAAEYSLLDLTYDCVYGCSGDGQEVAVGTTDFAPTAQAVVASDAGVAVISLDADAGPVLSALEAAGFEGEVILTMVTPLADASVVSEDMRARIRSVFPGVTPAEDFADRLREWYSTAGEGSFDGSGVLGGEAYDGTVLAALAAVRADSTDPADIADNLAAVSGADGGTPCSTYRRCAALLEAGEEIVYQGVAVDAPFDEDYDLTAAHFRVLGYTDEVGGSEIDNVIGRRD